MSQLKLSRISRQRLSALNYRTQFIQRCGAFSKTNASKEQIQCAVHINRRNLSLAGLISILPLPVEAGDLQGDLKAELDTQITGKVKLADALVSVTCLRSLGEDRYCRDLEPLGALTIGLYGRLVPITVDNFIKTVDAGAYNGTVFNKVRPGEYVSAGKQGTARNGEVEAPSSLQSNPELTSSKSFRLTHTRPGTVSLALAENEDSANVTLSKTYHPTQFLVTTGPGPAPRLNNGNVVFGRVLDGFDVLAKIAEVKTFTPAARVQAFNTLAKALGDERAEEARKSWGRPIQPVVIISSKAISEENANSVR